MVGLPTRSHSGAWGRFWSLSLAALCVVAGFTGCKPPEASGPTADTIPIGEYTSLTGKEATFGTSSHRATEMAVEEINRAGGILGKPLRLICEDDQSKAGEASTAVRKLISRDRVVALLGEVASPRSLEAAPIAQQVKIPMVSPSSINSKVTQVGDYIFRVCFTDKFQGIVLADFALKTMKADRVAILSDHQSDYSRGLADHFKARFTAKGGQVVAEPTYGGGDKDFRAQLTAIKAVNPKAVLVPGYYTEVGLIALQARQLGLDVPLFGGDGWESSKLVSIGGTALEGCFFSTHCAMDADSPKIRTFVTTFQQRYGEPPDALAALGYDSVFVLADALKRAGSTGGEALRNALAQTKDLDLVTGRISIDAERNARKPAVMLKIENGRFHWVETMQPD